MIVTRLIGGLGNQMFQYAHGLHLARQSEQECFLDVSGFDTYRLHELAIDHFAITAPRLPEPQRERLPGRYRGASRLRETAERVLAPFRKGKSAPLRLRREKPFGFQAKFASAGTDLYLDGYWQGEAFFPSMRSVLREEFTLAKPLSSQSSEIARQMADDNSVAVHVRRGNYVTDSETAKIFRCLDADYYRACLRDLQQHVASPKVYLFSNNTKWCLQNLDVGLPFIPVTHNDASTAHEDLYLISQCRHAVIANSSFSWWGAFLGEDRPGRKVYYPSPWFNLGTLDGSAIGCVDWISERSLASCEAAVAA
jgi:hypothetical protein